MGQMNVQSMAGTYPSAPNTAGRAGSGEKNEDFKSLLKERPESGGEPVDTAAKPKKGIDGTEASRKPDGAEKPEDAKTDESLAAMQVAQMLKENCTVTVLEETEQAEVTAVGEIDGAAETEAKMQVDVEGQPTVGEETAAAGQTVPMELVNPEEAAETLAPVKKPESRPDRPVEEPGNAAGKEPVKESLTSESIQRASDAQRTEKKSEVRAEKPEGKTAGAQSGRTVKTEEKQSGEEQQPVAAQGEQMRAQSTVGLQSSRVMTETETEAPGHPTPPENIEVAGPEEIPDRLAEKLLLRTSEGVREFEIQISPEHLGKIAIKVLYDREQTTVMIACSEKQTLEIVTQNAKALGHIMERNLGEEPTIYVEKQEPDYLNERPDDGENAGREAQQERQKEEQKSKHREVNAGDFLQKLRLGLGA